MQRENLFSINLDSDKVIDREELVIRRESEELSAKRAALNKQLMGSFHKSTRNTLLQLFISFISVMLGIVLFVFSFDNGNVHAVSLIVAIVLFAVGAISFIKNRNAKNSKAHSEELDDVNDGYGSLNELVRNDLCVPFDAKEIDIFTNMYSERKKDSEKTHSTDTAHVFEEDGNLCFWYGKGIISIPLSSIESLVKVDEEVKFDAWTKDAEYDSFDYSHYEIKKNAVNEYQEYYSMSGYYSLRFSHLEVPFEVIIPLYDIEPVLDILKIEPITE